MTIQDVFDGAQLLCENITALRQEQLFLTMGDDFDEYSQIVANHRPDQPLGAPFDPSKQFLPRSKGIWVIGRNAKGQVVHTQAMRLLDLADQSLAQYMQARFHDFPPGGVDLDLEGSWFRPGPASYRINGRVCYHGEMWLNDESGAYRGRGVVDILSRVAFLSCLIHWQPDFLIGFMLRPVARRGLAEREGYMHTDPYCLSWKVRNRNTPLDCNMVWMGHDDLRHIMHVPLGEIAA